jgi:putative ubiquitin-RnfH superfamily antitoxin RatB of RatAB toxin-antitoxin module
VREWAVELHAAATVGDAVMASGVPDAVEGFDAQSAMVGIWGRKAAWVQPVSDGDRVEVYRPLRVDPKVARRERFDKQGARAAGLFARRRPGGKPGY